MKIKYLLIILFVVLVLLFYNIFCYSVVNKSIYNGTNSIITNYLNSSCNNCEFDYDLKKALYTDDNFINIFVKVDSEYLEKYYRFIVIKNNNGYQLIDVNNEIPAYIK